MKKRNEFVITRIFNAPCELVWKAWTDPRSLEQWWGFRGFNIRVFTFDLKPGGIFHYSMQAGETPTMWGKFVFREIDAPERLAFVNSFDRNWPKEILNTVTFAGQDGKTKLTLRSWPVNTADEERKTFGDNFDSMNQGFGGTFDQLEEHLAELR